MKALTFALATTVLTATAAVAASDIGSFDRDGDRFVSYAEITASYPGVSRSDFRSIDANRDNRLSSVEIQSEGARVVLSRQMASQTGFTDLATVDTNGDNFVSFTELAGAYPGLSAIDWDRIARSGDRIKASELYDLETQIVLDRSRGGVDVVSLDDLDRDGSNFASFAEVATVYPRLSELDFQDIDLNNDNRISFSELNTLDTRTILSRSTR